MGKTPFVVAFHDKQLMVVLNCIVPFLYQLAHHQEAKYPA